MKIIEVNEFTTAGFHSIQKLLKLLTSEPIHFTETCFKELVASENSHLFFIRDEEIVAGMLTIGTYKSPTGTKAWIEDVVVDEVYRGRGLGKQMIRHAIDFVRSQLVGSLMLTSNPARIAANKLYQSLDFEQKKTNVYKLELNE